MTSFEWLDFKIYLMFPSYFIAETKLWIHYYQINHKSKLVNIGDPEATNCNYSFWDKNKIVKAKKTDVKTGINFEFFSKLDF